jgi:hypothetical protein
LRRVVAGCAIILIKGYVYEFSKQLGVGRRMRCMARDTDTSPWFIARMALDKASLLKIVTLPANIGP